MCIKYGLALAMATMVTRFRRHVAVKRIHCMWCGALDNLCAGNAVCRNRTQGHKPYKKQILHQRY